MKYFYLPLCFLFFCFQMSCSHLTIEMAPNIENTTSFTHYSHYFLFGLIGKDILDMDKVCPDQTIVQIKNYFTGEDVLFMLTTAGLYTPKSTKIWCEAPTNQEDFEEITL